MAYTLSNLLRDSLSHIGILKYGLATGGSTTTVVDTNHEAGEKDSDWKHGTAIILRDSGGAGAAPEGEFSRISAYAPNTSTFTLASTLTASPASGDRYGIARPTFHHEELIELSND